MKKLVGRKVEKEILLEAYRSDEAEMVAVIGRRRVGKTFLVRRVLGEKIALEFTGVQNSISKPQIENFHFLLEEYLDVEESLPLPKSWMEAFRLLIRVLKKRKVTDEKLVLFFDELPWLASRRSGFLEAFGFFWNNWASKNNVMVIICGSAASWMIKRVVQNRGGLHNRITKRIYLKPFTLNETEAFFRKKNIKFTRYQITQIYMVMGGVPHYLKEVKAGKSAAQNIDAICFSESGLLRDEFLSLYPALFERAERHIEVVRALGAKWKGLSRKEIVDYTKIKDGGGITKILKELIHSGFVSSYYPFQNKKREKLFRLTDEYTLFYLHFIEKKRVQESGMWKSFSQTPNYNSWSGFAFESLCMKHIPQIKKTLDIGGIYSESSSFTFRDSQTNKGTQIDLLIDRTDGVINLCEIKFHKDQFLITKEYAEKLQNKRATFVAKTKTKKQIFITLISTFGLSQNEYSLGLVDSELRLDGLFVEV